MIICSGSHGLTFDAVVPPFAGEVDLVPDPSSVFSPGVVVVEDDPPPFDGVVLLLPSPGGVVVDDDDGDVDVEDPPLPPSGVEPSPDGKVGHCVDIMVGHTHVGQVVVDNGVVDVGVVDVGVVGGVVVVTDVVVSSVVVVGAYVVLLVVVGSGVVVVIVVGCWVVVVGDVVVETSANILNSTTATFVLKYTAIHFGYRACYVV